MHRLTLGTVAIALVPSLAFAQDGSVHRAMATITPQDYQHRIEIIADDSMMGRDTPSRGLDLTAQWVAGEFERFGLRPGGDDGGYLQRYEIAMARTNVAASSLTLPGGRTLRFDRDATRVGGGYLPDGLTAPVVVVAGTRNLATALANVDLEGAIVIVPVETGPNGAFARASRNLIFGVWRAGPAALLTVADIADGDWTALQGTQQRAAIHVPWRDGGRGPLVMVREPGIASALQAAGINLRELRATTNATARLVPGMEVTLQIVPEITERMTAPNTVGILEGSDPELRDEYVVYSAHMDHVGTRCRRTGADTICNGADDDASGTVGVVQLAQAFSALTPRPRRSIIFLTVSGEERGLWGSDYFAGHPPVPIDNIVADLNADMIGRNWTDTIVVIGKEHSDLGSTLNRVNAAHPELDMTAIDDLWPDERFYFRSDHYNFARRGVPILFFFNGTHPDYHRPSDHTDKINSEKASRIVKLMMYLGLDVANRDARPQWKPESYREIVSE